MSDPALFGDFSHADPGPRLGALELELRALEIVVHWRRCGLTADWLAGFFAYDFEIEARAAAVSVLSTVANELLENAVKFCSDKQRAVRITIQNHGEFLRFQTYNRARAAHVSTLRSAIEALSDDALEQLFAERVQHQAEPGASGIGLLLLKKDYRARIGARVEPCTADEWDVEVRVDLDAAEVEQR